MPEYVRLDPNYENTIKFFGEVLCEGTHEQPYLAMWSMLDQMRYLTQTDIVAAQRVIDWFKERHERREPRADFERAEDSHLESDYEDRYYTED